VIGTDDTDDVSAEASFEVFRDGKRALVGYGNNLSRGYTRVSA
jgi:hypothetical protein